MLRPKFSIRPNFVAEGRNTAFCCRVAAPPLHDLTIAFLFLGTKLATTSQIRLCADAQTGYAVHRSIGNPSSPLNLVSRCHDAIWHFGATKSAAATGSPVEILAPKWCPGPEIIQTSFFVEHLSDGEQHRKPRQRRRAASRGTRLSPGLARRRIRE